MDKSGKSTQQGQGGGEGLQSHIQYYYKSNINQYKPKVCTMYVVSGIPERANERLESSLILKLMRYLREEAGRWLYLQG